MLGVNGYKLGAFCLSIVLFSMHAAEQSMSSELSQQLTPSSSLDGLSDFSDPDFFMHLIDPQVTSDDSSAKRSVPFAAQRRLPFLTDPNADEVEITESPDQPAAKRRRRPDAMSDRIEALESTVGFLAGVIGESNDQIKSLKEQNELLVTSLKNVTVGSFRGIVQNVSIKVLEALAFKNILDLMSLQISSEDASLQAIRLFTAHRFYQDSEYSGICSEERKLRRKKANEWFSKAEGKPIDDNMRPLYEKLKEGLCGKQVSSLLLGQSSLL